MKKDILVAGIYLADQKNNIREITKVLSKSSSYNVIQKWAAIAKNGIENDLKQLTVLKLQEKTPKFKILNLLLSGEDLSKYDFILIVDDDIELPDDFVDKYLTAVQKYDFALAQPARTHDSYIDHSFVEQVDGLAARKTRFVEIGPLFSIRKDLVKFILPFDEAVGMGWALDSVWPCVIEDVGLNMGIVDAFPVEHKMRAPVTNYRHDKAVEEMNAYLKSKKHLSNMERFRTLESYALIPAEELPLISVIIPTYNCRAYLCRAIDSVLAQKLEYLEVIIVDDASTDDTQDILKKTYENNPAVRVILHAENKKQGASCNTGIDAAKGKYIFFLDADDWLETGALAHLASISEKYNAEIVACGTCKVWENGEKESFHADAFSCNGGQEALYYYGDHRIGSFVWNKLYLLDFIQKNNLRFVVPYWHEDVVFTAEAVYLCKKFVSIKNEYYNYFQNKNSVTNKMPIPLHLESYIKLYVDMIEFIKGIDICKDEDGKQICWRLLQAHCSNNLWPKLVRYASTKSSSTKSWLDWELLCWNTCHKILGVDGYAVADFLIKATNTTLSNTAELERTKAELEGTKTELERITSSRGWKLLEKMYSSRGWKLMILLQRFAIQRINPLILLSSYHIKRYFKPKKPKKINLNSKKIVFVGHSYHAKTKSSEFILNYLKEIYDVEIILDESWNGGKSFPDLSFVDDSYLAVIFWQNLPSPEALAEIKNENLSFFPMYDAVGGLDVSWWLQYENLKIISFSETLHKKLERFGLDSMFIQYFPKPENFSPGNKNEVFFWQRITNVNINTIANIFKKDRVKLHIHKGVDPNHEFIQPTREAEKIFQITYSDWFESRDEMLEKIGGLIKQKGIYIAPREYEGIGLSYLEAMAMGKAVIAVDNPTMNEYIKHGINGYLFNLKSPKKIDLSNIEQVQKNAYEFICEGYKKYEEDKSRLIDFIKKS